MLNKMISAAVLVPLLAISAFAQDAADASSSYEGGQVVGDYRWAVYTACSLVFAAIVGYLIISHGSGAKLGEDIQHLERRVGELEAGA